MQFKRNLTATLLATTLALPAFANDAPVALIIAQGGLGDGSWNDTAMRASCRAWNRPS